MIPATLLIRLLDAYIGNDQFHREFRDLLDKHTHGDNIIRELTDNNLIQVQLTNKILSITLIL